MRVNIEHVEKSKGMVLKKKMYGLSVTVTFGEEELAIIKERKLERTVILERGIPADVDAYKHDNRGIVKRLATAAVAGADANHFDLTIGKLMKGTDTYFLDTPIEVKEYDAMLREKLPDLKNYIVLNEDIDRGSDSFEL